MGFMIFRLVHSGGVLAKIAFVFVTMCIITTVLAIILGLLFKPRTWCAVCPMGTLQGVIGRKRNLLRISEDCTECGTCEKVCPIGTAPGGLKTKGFVSSLDCIKCPECVVKCPKGALQFAESRDKSEPTVRRAS
jgi:polyferredoxin